MNLTEEYDDVDAEKDQVQEGTARQHEGYF